MAASAGVAAILVVTVFGSAVGLWSTTFTLTARTGAATFTARFDKADRGSKFSWRLDAPALGPGAIAVRLLVPGSGQPQVLTLCTTCRPTRARAGG